MTLLRTIARWSAGPVLGITLGLVLGTLADGPPSGSGRMSSRATLRGGPPEAVRLAKATHSLPAARPRPGWTVLAAASD